MNILFIRPAPPEETIGLQHVMIVEPLELEVLASFRGSDDTAVIVDLIIEKKPFLHFLKKYQPDMLCITGYITHIPVIIEYSRITKKYFPEIITVTGGVHCEVCPEDLDDSSIDYRVIRNATRVFPKLLQYLKNNGPFPSGILRTGEKSVSGNLPPIDFYFPFPDRKLTEKYRRSYFYIFHDKVALVKTAFGCPHKCTFCFCRKITGDTFGTRRIEEVILELQQIKEQEIYIVDDDFLASKKRLELFLDNIEKSGIKKRYLIYGRADFIAANQQLIKRFKDDGLRTVIVGLESFFDDELNDYNKQSNFEINKKALDVLNANAVDCFATVIIPPTWDRSHFRTAGDILLQLNVRYVNLQPLTPLPGTDLLIDKDKLCLSPDDYEKWDLAHVSILPDHLSVANFYREIIHLYNRVLFRFPVIIEYLKVYKPSQLFKMLLGSLQVRRQYEKKIRLAEKQEEAS